MQPAVESHSPPSLWQRLQSFLSPVLFYILIFLFLFAILAPFLWMVISSISPARELATTPPHWIPQEPTLARYKALIFGPEAGQSIPIAAEKFVRALTSSLVRGTPKQVTTIVAITATLSESNIGCQSIICIYIK